MLSLGLSLCSLPVVGGPPVIGGSTFVPVDIEQTVGVSVAAQAFAPITATQTVAAAVAAEAFTPIVVTQTASAVIDAEEEGAGDVTAPALVSAVLDSAGTTLTLTYDEALDDTSEPANTAWTLAGTSSAVTARNVTGSTVVLTLSPAAYRHETITLDYTAPGTNVQDLAGNDAANLNDQAVTNNTAARATDPLAIVTSKTAYWFLSSDIGVDQATVAGRVSTWQDQSAANNDATATASSTVEPSYNATGGPNSRGLVTFNGTDQWLRFLVLDLPPPGTTPIWFFHVSSPLSHTNGDNLYSGGTTGLFRCRQGTNTGEIACSNGTVGETITAYTVGSFFRVENGFGASDATDYLKIGSTSTTRPVAASGNWGNNNTPAGDFRMCTDAVTRFGHIAWTCFGAWNGEPTSGEKTLLDAWVTAYYGGSVGV